MFRELFKSADYGTYSTAAMQYLVTDTLALKLHGDAKKKELPGLDFETRFGKSIIPSMVYTFMYDAPVEDIIGKHKFKDAVPIILCMSCENGLVTGLNFNLVPNDVRAYVLDTIYNSWKSFYDRMLSGTADHTTSGINDELASILVDPDNRTKFLKIMDDVTGVKISNAYRVYNIEKITNIRMVEFDMWKYIPFLSFSDAIRGANLAALQASVIKDK